MYTIEKVFRFEAAHHLPNLPEGHKCAAPHGHSYAVHVAVTGAEIDPKTGFLVDFGDFQPMKKVIDELFDHHDLNDVVDQPTAETLAETLYQVAVNTLPLGNGHRVAAVRVHETATCWAEYRP